MRDIFSNYNTGERQWTFDHQTFTEEQFRDLFDQVLPNDILHNAAIAYTYYQRIAVRRFSVPMNSPAGLCRDVYFVEVMGSQYCDMFSCVYFQLSPFAETLADHYDDAYIGLMTEYEILDLVEPANDIHQRALIDTWFDTDNWFGILSANNVADHPRLDNIVNGYDPERQLDPVADEFVPELGPNLNQAEVAYAHWIEQWNNNNIAYWVDQRNNNNIEQVV